RFRTTSLRSIATEPPWADHARASAASLRLVGNDSRFVLGSQPPQPPIPYRRTPMKKLRCATLLVAGLVAATTLRAADAELNVYSARHYQTDQRFYDDFTKQTGIRINLIEGSDSALMERLSSEGANSPADVLILVDAARLWKAEEAGLFQPVKSDVLADRIPEHLRSIDDGEGSKWFGVSRRARIIVYNPDKVDGDKVRNYADLADPALKGMVCTRTGTHPYMLSLIGAMVEHM